MLKVFATLKELAASEYIFRITDNGGSSVDRYTIAISDGDYFAMSGAPTHPQGFSQSGEGIDPQVLADWVEEGDSIDLALGDLPRNVAEHVLYRVNQGWADCLEAIEAREKYAVAPTREKAEVNRGLYNSGGQGIYAAGEGFCIRMEGSHAANDRGPFLTAAEALRATLPDHYSNSGEEFHSTVNVGRLRKDRKVALAIARLEKRRDAEWEKQREAELERRTASFSPIGKAAVMAAAGI